MDGCFPVSHEKKIRSVLRNAQRMILAELPLNETATLLLKLQACNESIRKSEAKIARLQSQVEAAEEFGKRINEIGKAMKARGI